LISGYRAKYHDPLDEVMLLHFVTLRFPSDLLLEKDES
jgi:hypothetical protein